MAYKTVIRSILLASDKFPLFQINRISGKPKDTSGYEKSKVVLEKGKGSKQKAHNRRFKGDGILRCRRGGRFHAQKPLHQNSSNLISFKTKEVVLSLKIVLKKLLLKCSICFNQCKLPAAACSTCYAVLIGCVHCLEQWIGDKHLWPSVHCVAQVLIYTVIPIVRKIANILWESVPRGNIVVESDTRDTNTIPYGHGDED